MRTVTQYTPSPFTDYTTLRLQPSEWRPSPRPNPTTWYIIRATARLTEAPLNNPGLQGTPAARRRRSPHRSPTTVASPAVALPRRSASIQAPAAATVLIGRTTMLQCYALLPACLRFLHMVKNFRIVSYRIAIFCVISYRIESCPLWLYRAITKPVIRPENLVTSWKRIYRLTGYNLTSLLRRHRYTMHWYYNVAV